MAQLAQGFELGWDVTGQLGCVQETCELFARSCRHGHGFSDHGSEASLGEFAWESRARGSLWFVCSRVWWNKREEGCLKMLLEQMEDFDYFLMLI